MTIWNGLLILSVAVYIKASLLAETETEVSRVLLENRSVAINAAASLSEEPHVAVELFVPVGKNK